eukprot:CAMPEP_0171101184 /NCGR_PEP_ID=MMETSP0766_2-20121228/54201_1 /TAXON_ID=439317 /ORGANISM="Gambierdiscus australes, Strain CAWD 149" /LENGTH=78 /DNA_ID=CAMNT_0011561165 /DNA_START=40 /DNA_END=276 /DNA_ORIENTATION=+
MKLAARHGQRNTSCTEPPQSSPTVCTITNVLQMGAPGTNARRQHGKACDFGVGASKVVHPTLCAPPGAVVYASAYQVP